MSSTASACRSYIVAASIGAVEALKDHGFARWNYPLRTLHHRLNNHIKSTVTRASRAASTAANSEVRKNRAIKTEKSINKVMELHCWGPSTFK